MSAVYLDLLLIHQAGLQSAFGPATVAQLDACPTGDQEVVG